jgi:integrase
MARKGDGVEIREKSIRMTFNLDGVPQRQTLMVDGKPMPPTPANIKFAHRLAGEIRDRIRYGTFSMAEYFPSAGTASVLTVEAWFDTWLKAQRIERSTKDGYASAIKFWNSSICDNKQNTMGQMLLRSLKHSHVRIAIANRPDLSGKTINNYVSVLRDALSLAVRDRLMTSNPVDDVPRAKHQKPCPDPFSRDELEAIIAEAARTHPGNVHNLIETWFWTGLRTSEILGLDWPNIDLASGHILVAKALVAGEEKDRTKTSVARVVQLNSRARAALQRQRALTQMNGGRVFQDPRYNEDWKNEEAFQRVFWARMLKRLGMRYRRPYTMRHSYATVMLMSGMTPAFCARQLGHSVEIFLNTYSKWIDGGQNDLEMARLESSLSSPEIPHRKGSGDNSLI